MELLKSPRAPSAILILIFIIFSKPGYAGERDIAREEIFPSLKRIVVEPAFQYTLTSKERVSVSGFTLFEAVLVGKVETSKLERALYAPSLTLKWGFERMEIWGKVPWLYRHDKETLPVEGRTVDIKIDDDYIGDVETGQYFQLVKEKGLWPDIVLNLRQKYRTGRDPYGLPLVSVDPQLPPRTAEFPTGSGHLGVAGGLSLVKTSNPAVLFVSAEYFYNIPRSVGVQGGIDYGKVDPGDSIEFGFGEVFALNERLSSSISYKQRLTGVTKQNGTPIVGSDVNAASLYLGMTYAMGRQSLSVNIGIGLTEDASDVDILVRMPFSILR